VEQRRETEVGKAEKKRRRERERKNPISGKKSKKEKRSKFLPPDSISLTYSSGSKWSSVARCCPSLM
jgi:hypothetical protein